MRENRTYGSEGGEAKAFPTPISRKREKGKRSAVSAPLSRLRPLAGEGLG
jgi:hypothetical protein